MRIACSSTHTHTHTHTHTLSLSLFPPNLLKWGQLAFLLSASRLGLCSNRVDLKHTFQKEDVLLADQEDSRCAHGAGGMNLHTPSPPLVLSGRQRRCIINAMAKGMPGEETFANCLLRLKDL